MNELILALVAAETKDICIDVAVAFLEHIPDLQEPADRDKCKTCSNNTICADNIKATKAAAAEALPALKKFQEIFKETQRAMVAAHEGSNE